MNYSVLYRFTPNPRARDWKSVIEIYDSLGLKFLITLFI